MPSDKTDALNTKRKIVFVTGLSGAGMSSALKILEDIGYEVFDNFPLPFVDPLIAEEEHVDKPVAFALDTRSRGFSAEAILGRLEDLRSDERNDVTMIFLICSNAVLQKRFSETRRGHPLAKDRPVIDGIHQERSLTKALVDNADHVIDTTELSIHDLRRQIESALHPDESKRKLTVTVMSFGFKNGVPRESDMVLDVRFLANPHWEPTLRPKTGLEIDVQKYIAADPDFDAFKTHTMGMLALLLPRYAQEGKFYFTLAVGCTGGKHRSVCIADELSRNINDMGFTASLRHRDISN